MRGCPALSTGTAPFRIRGRAASVPSAIDDQRVTRHVARGFGSKDAGFDEAGLRAESEHPGEKVGEHLFVADAEAGDRRVVEDLGHPIAQIRRQQARLVTVAVEEVLSHGPVSPCKLGKAGY